MSVTFVRFGSPARGPSSGIVSLTALPARARSLFAARLLAAVALCGCQSSSESVRQTRAESISPAKGDDTALLASGNANPGSGVITKASDAAESGSGSPLAAQTAATTPARSGWTNLFGRKETPNRVVLPRNDQAGETDAADGASGKTAANEF